MRTGEKAVRTAAKRRTRVRRLCECTILQGDEAQRNNPVIRPRNKKNAQRAIFYLCAQDADENRGSHTSTQGKRQRSRVNTSGEQHRQVRQANNTKLGNENCPTQVTGHPPQK